MELFHLREIINGTTSLAEIEKLNPVLGNQLAEFVTKVRDCCKEAYERLSKALSSVVSLSSKPTDEDIEKVLVQMREAPDSNWFKNVSGICDRLAALAKNYKPAIDEQIQYARGLNEDVPLTEENMRNYVGPRSSQMSEFMRLLQRHEGDLKDDLRRAVSQIEYRLGSARGTGDVEDARAYALKVQEEIAKGNDQIAQISYQIGGTSSNGAEAILSPGDIAEKALRRPEIMAIISMFFLLVVFYSGAAVFRFLTILQFILLTGFTLTAVVVVNAFYLKTIDKLSEESFLKLMELALLKFFAPLTRSVAGAATGEPPAEETKDKKATPTRKRTRKIKPY
jgi:hypothetical protein